MPPRHLNIILITASISILCYFTVRRTRSAMLVGDALNMIDMYYVDPVDRNDLLRAAMNGLTDGLDQHSEFISMEDYETFQDNIQQEFAGIGIYVEQPDGEPVRVITPLVGSPALQAGLRPGDKIVQVDDEDVSTMSLQEVSMRLKGPIGTEVDLLLLRAEESIATTVRRGRIKLESIVGDYRDENDGWVYRLQTDPGIAYIRLTSFGEKTRDDLAAVLKDLNNEIEALILDLRGNGGGLLNMAADITDMFLDSGNIVSTRIRGGVIEDEFNAEPGTLIDADIPMAVLIDGSSASASEILAAALQDNGRAIIVGSRSFGKGTVQNILPLQYGRSALRLTVARYYRPSGVNIHRGEDATEQDAWGVSPDEGGDVELDIETLKKIDQRWREAAYPSLAEFKPHSESSDTEESGPEPDQQPDEDPGVDSAISIDPQLQRAVEMVREKRIGSRKRAA